MSAEAIARDLLDQLGRHGGAMYGKEAVTQLAHAVQCATHAEAAGATPATITACLLHDFGHIVLQDDADAAEDGIDLVHEEVGAQHLSQWFGPEVTEPIRLHVPAKRYLVATDPDYFATLSPASVTSLRVQGGAYVGRDAEHFASQPYAMEAVKLRRWDDLAKDPSMRTPPLRHFRSYIEACL